MESSLSVDLLNSTWKLRLPTVDQLRRRLPESFVYHLPLPGPNTDFYLQAERENVLYLAVANAPGEGLETSLFTQLAYEYMAAIIYHPSVNTPAEALNYFQDYIRDAMDHPSWSTPPELRLAVVKVDQENLTITYAGAGLSIYWKGQGDIEEITIGHEPIRGGAPRLDFHDYEMNGQPGNQLYLSTDGYHQLAASAGIQPLIDQLREIIGYDFRLKAPVLESVISKTLKEHQLPDDVLILGAGLEKVKLQ